MFIEEIVTGSGQRAKGRPVAPSADLILIGPAGPPTSLTLRFPDHARRPAVDRHGQSGRYQPLAAPLWRSTVDDWSKGPPAKWQQVIALLHQAGRPAAVVMVANNDSLLLQVLEPPAD